LPLLARTLLTGRPWRATPFDLPLVLLALGTLLGSYASLSRDGTLVRVAGLVAGLYLFVLAREHAGSERRLRSVVLASLVAAVLASAALLVLTAPFLRLEHLPPIAGLVAAVDRWQIGAWVVDQDWLLQRYRFRASGVGAMADVGLALAFAAWVGLQGRLGRGLVGLATVFFAMVLLVADNRGSILAAGMTLGVMATAWRRRLLPLVPLVLLAVVVLVALSPTDRGLSLKTLAQRFWFWENSVYLAQEVPLTGAGLRLESVQLVYRAYFMPTYPPFSHANDIYLQGLLEYGIFGLAALAGFGVATLWLAWRPFEAPGRWTEAGRLASLGVGLALLTTGLTEIVMLTSLGGAIGLAGLGLLAGVCGSVTPTSSPQSGPLPLTTWVTPASGRGGMKVWAGLIAIGVLLVGGMVVSGAGAWLAGRALLSVGTAELNRGSLSETIGRGDRAAAVERAVSLLRLAGSFSPSDPAIQRNLALALSAGDDDRRGRAAADRAKALTSADNRQDLFQLGRAYVAVSAWGEAIKAWQAASAQPQLLQLGSRLIRARNLDQAENAYVMAARLDPSSRGAFEGIVTVARQHELSTAETIDRLAPLLEPGSPTEYGARLEAARVYREAGQLPQAMSELGDAAHIRSDSDLVFEIGMVALRAGLADVAEPMLAQAAEDDPYEPDTWLWLARSRARLGRHDEAIATIRQGLSRVDPSGQFASPAERLPETAAVLAVEIKRSERAGLLGVMGESLLALGRPGDAMPALDEAIAARPNDPWLAETRAAAQAALGGVLPNLLANPRFTVDDAWVLRPPTFTVRPTLATLPSNLPTIADSQARLAPRPPGSQVLVQEVANVTGGERYRLTARLRGERLGAGAVYLTLVSTDAPSTPLATALTTAGDWATVEIEADLTPDGATGA
jgi:tetratricopeptide (TPR) repeat protein/O-antigen ligase